MRLHAMILGFFLMAAFLAGCGSGHDHHHDHVHVAPHGGVLIELGDHAYQIELVHDAGAGSLMLYVLDAHAEKPVRIAQPGITLELRAGSADPIQIMLEAQAVAASGETPGDTSVFAGSHEALKQSGILLLKLNKLSIGGRDFEDVPGHLGKRRG